MIVGEYLHRNGETVTPTEPGLYWFQGQVFSRQCVGLFCLEYYNGDAIAMGWRPFGDSSEILYGDLGDFNGRWWGPVTPPWGDTDETD